jgi:branched-subunit amino acid transport protein
MAAVTFLTRLPLWLLAARRVSWPRSLGPFLEQIPIAAFAAIVFTTVLQPQGSISIDPSNLYIYAAVLTIGAALLLRGSLLPTILIGTTAAVLLQALFG